MTHSGTHTITHTVTAHDLENRSILEESFEESVNQQEKALSDITEVEQIIDLKKQFTFLKKRQMNSPTSTI